MGDHHHHQGQSITSLISRVDRLDTMILHIEGKQNAGRCRKGDNAVAASVCKAQKKILCRSLDRAVQETHSRGSLLQRISSLEDRLVKLCLEIDSGRQPSESPAGAVHSSLLVAPPPSSTEDHNKSQREELSISPYPTFKNSKSNKAINQDPQLSIDEFELQQKKNQRENQRLKKKHRNTTAQKQKVLNSNNESEKTCKNGSKAMGLGWPHFKILGC